MNFLLQNRYSKTGFIKNKTVIKLGKRVKKRKSKKSRKSKA